MIPIQLDEKFSAARPHLFELKRQLTDTLAAFADSRSYPFVGRIKTPQSLSEKIEMGRVARFSEIDDLVAFTLVIPTAANEADVVDFCRKTFSVIEVRDKQSTSKPPDVFRFDSTRVVARLPRPADVINLPQPSIYSFLFEIQVRTAFEHAWSVATHDLVYKGAAIDWRRVRLAAQLKASTEGLDAAVTAFDQLATGISQSPWKTVKEQVAVSNFVSQLFDTARLPTVLRPASNTRFVENLCRLAKSIVPSISIERCLNEIDTGLKDQARGSIPASLSLYQLFLGILCDRGLVTKVEKLQCHVTPQLEALFPKTSGIGSIFDYSG